MSHRRAHKKSRLGCSECKRRHIKCDEARPSCTNCLASNQTCVYQAPAKRGTPPDTAIKQRLRTSPVIADVPGITSTAVSPSPSIGHGSSNTSGPLTPIASITSASTITASSTQGSVLDPPLNMRHMELLSHFINVTGPSFAKGRPFDPEYVRISLSAAQSTPCLMYELLALSALHLSQLRPEQAVFYRAEAVALQTQALSLFNETKAHITADNCSSVLLFSSYLGLHALAEAVVALETSADGFLDKFVNYLKLHQGVRIITKQAWLLLKQSNVSSILKRAEALLAGSSQLDDRASSMSDHLRQVLAFDNMSIDCKTACQDAIAHLRLLYQFESTSGQSSLTQEHYAAGALIWTWPVTLSTVFTDLLMQRRPEALIILCHYAVLLHYRRHTWFVGAAGRTLIQGITGFLGTYWMQWLEWPNEVLEGALEG